MKVPAWPRAHGAPLPPVTDPGSPSLLAVCGKGTGRNTPRSEQSFSVKGQGEPILGFMAVRSLLCGLLRYNC